MIKYIFTICFLSCISTSLLAQKDDEPKKGYIGFGAGPAYPVGNFGSSNWDNENSGFAANGFQFTAIEFGVKFVPNFGMAASFKGANVPLDVKTIANFYAQEYGGQFVVTSKRWNYGGLYVGPFVSIPTRYVDVDFKFMTGFILAFSPELEIVRTPDYVRQEAATGPSFSLTVGANARIHLSNSFSLSCGIEYLSARPIFTLEYSDNNSIQTETVYQNINVVNLSAGIAFRLF